MMTFLGLRYIALVLAILAYSPIAFANENEFCVKIKWWRSSDSNLSARQRNEAVPFAKVNDYQLLFYWVPGTEVPPFPNGVYDEKIQAIESLSSACFPRKYLRPGKNKFQLNFFWGIESWNTGTGEGSMFLDNGLSTYPLCRQSVGSSTDSGSCIKDVELELSQIDPELAAKVERLAKLNVRLASELEALKKNYAGLKNFIAELEKRFDELGVDLFDKITAEDFKEYQADLIEVLNLIKSHKASLSDLQNQSNSSLQEANSNADAVRKALADVLKREGSEVRDVDVLVPEISDIDVELPKTEDEKDPFDPENDPYDLIAKETIGLIEKNWPNRRFEIQVVVNAWNKKQGEVAGLLAARSRISPAEMVAYQASVKKVREFVLETGCGGKGCLSEDGWFKDSLVPQDVRRALKSELRAIDPVKSELLEEQMKVWQIEAENQRKVIGVVTALASGARVLSQLAADQSAFVRTKLDTILASTLEAAKTGMCRAGTLAPGVNDAVDFYEAVFAKDVCTGETLTPWQQALTGIGLIFGQGKFWRSLDNEISGIGKGIAKAEGIAAEFSGLNRKIFVGERQLQKKWKHAEVFGISGSYTKENAVKYERAISEHISSPKTKVISGTYKHSKNVVHYVNPDNGLLVMKDEAGVFISGWKLSEAQLKNVLERGSL